MVPHAKEDVPTLNLWSVVSGLAQAEIPGNNQMVMSSNGAVDTVKDGFVVFFDSGELFTSLLH
jgi:hypothetical protein